MENSWELQYIKEEADIYLKRWFNQLGIEGTIEMVERCPIETVKKIYMDALRIKQLVK